MGSGFQQRRRRLQPWHAGRRVARRTWFEGRLGSAVASVVTHGFCQSAQAEKVGATQAVSRLREQWLITQVTTRQRYSTFSVHVVLITKKKVFDICRCGVARRQTQSWVPGLSHCRCSGEIHVSQWGSGTTRRKHLPCLAKPLDEDFSKPRRKAPFSSSSHC